MNNNNYNRKEILQTSSAHDIRQALQCGKPNCPCKRRNGNVHCPVAGHTDRVPSLSVNERNGKTLFKCHGNCGQDVVLKALQDKGLYLGKPKHKVASGDRNVTSLYDYKDEKDNLIYQVVRKDFINGSKHIRQRRPSPNKHNEWIYDLNGVRRVLFLLPQVIAAKQVIVVEGEKCAERMNAALKEAGIYPDTIATTNSGGAGKWSRDYNKYLTGKTVIVLPDNDQPGYAHAESVCNELESYAAQLKLVTLTGLKAKEDIVNWFDHGNSLADFRTLVNSTSNWANKVGNHTEESTQGKPNQIPTGAGFRGAKEGRELPTIQINDRQLSDIAQDGVDALVAANKPVQMFSFGNKLAEISNISGEQVQVALVSACDLKARLALSAIWVKSTPKGERDAAPSRDLADVVMYLCQSTGGSRFPTLLGIVTAPIFAPNGSVCYDPGYDPATRLYYYSHPPLALELEPVTDQAITAAKKLILEELLGDFPFADLASRAHAISLLLLPFVRQLINGPTPLHHINAPMAGTGKGLLAMACTFPFLGKGIDVTVAPQTEEEWRKRITSTLNSAAPIILVDNACKLESPNLAAVLTATQWTDRKLSVSENISVPARSVWVATTNNATLSDDIARRTISIRMDAKVEKPYLREGFQHDDLRGWASENRAKLVSAAHVLIRAWLKAGQPNYKGKNKIPGSYESWGKVMGGILDVIDVPGFLDNAKDLYDNSDYQTIAWKGFVEAWYNKHGEKLMMSKDLIPLAVQFFPDEYSGPESGSAPTTKLGRRLGQIKDRVFGEYKLVHYDHLHGAIRYKVMRLNSQNASPSTNLKEKPSRPCRVESREGYDLESGYKNNNQPLVSETANVRQDDRTDTHDSHDCRYGYPDIAGIPVSELDGFSHSSRINETSQPN